MRERFAQAEPTESVQRSLASLREVSAIVDARLLTRQRPSKPGYARSARRSQKLP